MEEVQVKTKETNAHNSAQYIHVLMNKPDGVRLATSVNAPPR